MNGRDVSGTFTLIADDYAMTAGVSRGILRLLEQGRLSGAGAMTGMPAWKGWHSAFKGFAGERELGLHLNLTLGSPLTEMPFLAPAGRLPTIGQLAGLALSFRIPVDEVRAEIAAQIDAFEQAMDRRPDFIDGHQHAHGLPGVRRALLAELAERYPDDPRPWLRDAADRPGRILARGGERGKALAVAGLSAGFGTAAARAGFRTNDGFAGFSAFDPAADYGALFSGYLRSPGRAHLVMCHPGEVDDDLRALDPAVGSREVELAFLAGDEFSGAVAAAGLALGRAPPT
jgi:hypothetical protein